jgi:dUTPase
MRFTMRVHVCIWIAVASTKPHAICAKDRINQTARNQVANAEQQTIASLRDIGRAEGGTQSERGGGHADAGEKLC